MCKGDHGDGCYGPNGEACPNGGRIDHVEPIYGIFSNHSLNDTRVYDDDWIVHASDQDKEPYYRAFSTLEDTPAMEGNCRDAQAFPGKNEMYPCFDSSVTYGVAVKGLSVTEASLPLALEVRDLNHNDIREPDVRLWPKWLHHSIPLQGTVHITGLVSGEAYTLYRYNSTVNVPEGPPYDRTAERVKHFVAPNTEWFYEDPKPFESHSATYYVAIKQRLSSNGRPPATAA